MRVLVTGGAGYIGTELTSILVQDSEIEQVLVYDNLSRTNYNFFLGSAYVNHEKIKFVNADILDSRSLNEAMAGIDIVYHLAAKVTTPFANQGPHGFEQINHWGAAEVAGAVEKNAIPQVVFVSSASVYGATSEEVDEFHEPNPQTFYGISKANGETHFSRLFKKNHCLTIRCGNVYGYSSSMRFDSVINKFMFNANFHRRVNVNGDGNQVRSFAHIRTVASILANLRTSNIPSGTYNLVEETFSINQILETLQTIYPDLERIHINRDIKLRELRVRPNARINQLAKQSTINLKDALVEFSQSFSF